MLMKDDNVPVLSNHYVDYLKKRLSASDLDLVNVCLQVNVAIENEEGVFVDAKNESLTMIYHGWEGAPIRYSSTHDQ